LFYDYKYNVLSRGKIHFNKKNGAAFAKAAPFFFSEQAL
jgi:hypothetical protein